MIPVQEAQSIIEAHFPFHKGLTPVVQADRDYPPFHRVMMDGIAIKFSDYTSGQRTFEINGIAAAGEPQKTLQSGCFEVMTGAPLPHNADLVIQYEHLEINEDSATIVVDGPRSAFDSVHLMGSDCHRGDVVLNKGLKWNGPHVGIATSMGSHVKTETLKIMVISTGDELVEEAPLPHQIRRSNVHALKASLELFGHKEIELAHLNDDPILVASHYQENSPKFDVMIYSGGVSKGKFDYLPNVWADMSITRHFHEVSQRPGKPLWFGTDDKLSTTVIGLPGNPVSSLVCLHRYFLKGKEIFVKLAEEVSFNKPLTFFVPATLEFKNGEVWAHPLKIKNSGEFTALAGSDGFIELPKDQNQFKAGEVFQFFAWRPL